MHIHPSRGRCRPPETTQTRCHRETSSLEKSVQSRPFSTKRPPGKCAWGKCVSSHVLVSGGPRSIALKGFHVLVATKPGKSCHVLHQWCNLGCFQPCQELCSLPVPSVDQRKGKGVLPLGLRRDPVPAKSFQIKSSARELASGRIPQQVLVDKGNNGVDIKAQSSPPSVGHTVPEFKTDRSFSDRSSERARDLK